MNPTREQIQWVWEKCGFTEVPKYGGSDYSEILWRSPIGSHSESLPLIDLNNLFKYAVPKLEGKYDLDVSDDSELLGKSVCFHSITNRECSAASPIEFFRTWDEFYLALFCAIYKAFQNEQKF